MTETNALGNIKIEEEYATFTINPKIYPLEVIYSAAYIMIDKAFIILDGDPETEIIVEIRKKEEANEIKDLVVEFNEELLNYATYITQMKRTKVLREILLNKALGKPDDK
jgi:His-Xaa-Ser system protein HxsD